MAERIETVAGSVLARSLATATGAVTEHLIATLQGIAVARQIHAQALPDAEEGEGTTGTADDGGVKAAFDSAMIRVLGQIENVVSNPKHWKVRTRETAAYTRVDLNTRIEKIRRGLVDKPSLRHGGDIKFAVASGKVVAYLELPGGAIVGTGSTAAAALEDFDRAWREDAPRTPQPAPEVPE